MDEASSIASIVRDLKTAADGSMPWKPCLEAIAALVGAQSGFLRVVGTQCTSVLMSESTGYDEHFVRMYREHFVHLDPYRKHFRAAVPGTLLVTDRLVDRNRHHRTEYFNDYERPQDLHQAAGGTVAKVPIGTIEIGFQRRGRRSGSFSGRQLGLLESLFPHLQRAVFAFSLGATSVSIEDMALAAVAQMTDGVALFDESLRCRYANDEARRLVLNRASRLDYEGISLLNPEDTDQLHRLMSDGLAGRKGELRGLRSAADIVWIARPLGQAGMASDGPKTIGVALCMREERRRRPDWNAFVKTYGLSTAEARVVEGVVIGLSLREIADRAHLSIHTVRSQLANSFSKTQTHRQAQLVTLARAVGGSRTSMR